MTGLWKAWKAKSRLPTLSTSPLEISPKAGEIPTFPQRRRRGRMEKWKTKTRFSTFPPPRILSLRCKDRDARPGCRPPPRYGRRRCAPPPKNQRKETSRSIQLRAHPALERNCYFRLISHWNRFSISGSFLDWKMLSPEMPRPGMADRSGRNGRSGQAHGRSLAQRFPARRVRYYGNI